MEERNLKVWDIVEYDKQLVVVTEIDFTGKSCGDTSKWWSYSY